MRNHPLDHKRTIVQKKILVALFVTLFTVVSSTAAAYAQQRQDVRSPLPAHSQQAPPASPTPSESPTPGHHKSSGSAELAGSPTASPAPRHHKHHKHAGSAAPAVSPTPSESPTPGHHKSSGSAELVGSPTPSGSPAPRHHKHHKHAGSAAPAASPTPSESPTPGHHKSSGSTELSWSPQIANLQQTPPPGSPAPSGSPTPSEHHKPSGNADMSWNSQSHALTVTLHLSGLQPGSTHAAHIHAGTCSARGKVLYPFQDITADKNGNATLATAVNNVTDGIPATGWNITVHQGSSAETSTLLCGNVENPKKATSVSVQLHHPCKCKQGGGTNGSPTPTSR